MFDKHPKVDKLVKVLDYSEDKRLSLAVRNIRQYMTEVLSRKMPFTKKKGIIGELVQKEYVRLALIESGINLVTPDNTMFSNPETICDMKDGKVFFYAKKDKRNIQELDDLLINKNLVILLETKFWSGLRKEPLNKKLADKYELLAEVFPDYTKCAIYFFLSEKALWKSKPRLIKDLEKLGAYIINIVDREKAIMNMIEIYKAVSKK